MAAFQWIEPANFRKPAVAMMASKSRNTFNEFSTRSVCKTLTTIFAAFKQKNE